MTQDSSTFVADPELLGELNPRSRPIDIGTDRLLFRQGDKPPGVYILRKGSAILTLCSKGVVVMRMHAEAGSLLGLPAVIGAKPYTLSAEVTEDAELSMIASDEFIKLMGTQPTISFKVLQILAQEVSSARELLSRS